MISSLIEVVFFGPQEREEIARELEERQREKENKRQKVCRSFREFFLQLCSVVYFCHISN